MNTNNLINKKPRTNFSIQGSSTKLIQTEMNTINSYY